MIQGYHLISTGHYASTHGGLVIYLNKKWDYTIKATNTLSKLWEKQVIEILDPKRALKKKIVVGNIYRPPYNSRDNLNTFMVEFNAFLLENYANGQNTYMCGDYNLDLLKIHSVPFNENYFDNILSCGYIPTITLPTRLSDNSTLMVFLCGDYNIDLLKINTNDHFNIFYENVISSSFIPNITLPTRMCDTTSTLIDNIYTNAVDKDHTSGILIRPISDHQMYFSMINLCYTKLEDAAKFIEVEVCNQESINKFVKEVGDANIYNKLQKNLNTNPNHNYEILSKHLLCAKLKHIPRKVKKFNKRRHLKEKWMTKELLQEVVTKNKLYVEWKTTPVTHINYDMVKQRFKGFDKIVKKNIKEAKRIYFDKIFIAYRSDMKKTWRTINETLNRNKKSSNVPSLFYDNGRTLSNMKEIANAFNVYFANIGEKLASEIEENVNNIADYTNYISVLPSIETRFQFKCITDGDTRLAIDNLENKSSSGHDGISNKLLKLLKFELSKSLTLIINQMITTGVFFSICINDLITVSDKLKFIMYADDTTIYFNLEDFDRYNLEQDITNELENITLWLKRNKLSLNVQKTKLMIFHRKQKQINELNILIDGIAIERVESFNFLGLIIDEGISWKKHTDVVKNKISKVVGILYRLNNIFPKNILQTLYNSLIASYINYGLLLWGVESNRIELLQKKAIRLITNSNYTAHTTPLFIELGLLKIQDMFKLKLLKFYYKLSSNLLPKYFESYRDVIERAPVRELRQHYIHPPLIRKVYAECSPLFQLIELINTLKADKNDTILEKIRLKSHTFYGFSFNVTMVCLNAYDLICRLNSCYTCNRQQ